jgi:uncharacterized protein YqgV (UPF0045/DUF77 family)
MKPARVEVLVEPFRENDPGPHVTAAVSALEDADLPTDMGPFATVATGELDQVLGAVTSMLRASFEAGAEAIQLRVERTG